MWSWRRFLRILGMLINIAILLFGFAEGQPTQAAPPGRSASAPPPPTGLHVTGATTNSVSWAWSESDPAASFIYTFEGLSFLNLPAGTTALTKSNIVVGYYGCLSIAAVNNGMTSSFTPWSCSYVVPFAPFNPQQTGVTSSTATISWMNADTLSYEQAYDYAGATWNELGRNATSYVMTGITPGNYNCVALQAFNLNHASPYSYACGYASPNAPVNLHATAVSPTQVTFSWTAPDPYSNYIVYDPSVYHLIGMTTTYTTMNVIPSGGHGYACLYVAAYNAAAVSPYVLSCVWAS